MNEYTEIMTIDNMVSMSFDDIYNAIIDKYKYVNGINKFNSLYYKIFSSKKLTRLIMESKFYKLSLDYKTVLEVINSVGFFMVKNNKTQFVGLVIFYKRWNNEVNKDANIASDEYIRVQCRQCYNNYVKYLK